jgi:para-nitrobenzyl esterase
VQALQWVRDNAESFGGDPNLVTIFGQSGGGAKVSCLMDMDSAKGLFHRAVVESGAYLKLIEREKATASAKSVLDALGLTPETADQIRTLPMEKLQQAAGQVAGAGSGPVLDGKNFHRHPFTPDAPPQSASVPLLIGINRTEMINLTGRADPDIFDLTWDTMQVKLQKARPTLDVSKIIVLYRKLHPQFNPTDVYLAATTDSSLLRNAVAEAERKSVQGGAPAYFYLVDWNTPVDGGRWRTPHSVEIAFVFDNVANVESMVGPNGPEQQKMVEEMSSAWIAFAHSGDPNTPAIPNWPTYDAKRRAAMVFGIPPKVVNDPHGEERSWFKDLPWT